MVVKHVTTESRRHSSLLFKDTVLQIQGLCKDHSTERRKARQNVPPRNCTATEDVNFHSWISKQSEVDTGSSVSVNELLMSMKLNIHEHLKHQRTL